jgi:hypothetical protein
MPGASEEIEECHGAPLFLSEPEAVATGFLVFSKVQCPKSNQGERTLDLGCWTLDLPFNPVATAPGSAETLLIEKELPATWERVVSK